MKENVSENSLKGILEIKEYKNKYRLASEEIYVCLGKGNYSNIFNCMTRFRAIIVDKNLVNIDNLKKMKIVKGIHWNGQELQIIIGGEVVKVVDEFKKYEIEALEPVKKTDKTEIFIKHSIGSRILAAITGIMGPSIGMLMAVGIIGAIYAMLTLPDHSLLTAKILNPEWQEGMPEFLKWINIDVGNLYLFDMWSAVMFLLTKVVLNGLGIFFIYNTAMYFKGNPWFALAVGMTLASRGFFPQGGVGTPWADAQFGDWTSNMGKSGFLLFKLGDYPIAVGGFEGAVIPYIVGGIMVVYLDKWIKTWMPTTVDILFRSTLVYLITMFGLWFAFGPIAALIEYGLSQGMTYFGKIPYGFGTALVAMFWQPLVLTGAHVAAVMPMTVDLAAGNPSPLLPALMLGVWAQVGASMGVAIATKNSNLRSVCWGGIPAGMFGITEPLIYGVNLPKMKPLLLGCIGAFIAGLVHGLLGIESTRMAGMGIFAILGFEMNVKTILFVLLTWVISIGGSALLVALLYTERKNEFNYFKKGINKLTKLVNGEKTTINKEFEEYTKEIKSLKNDYQKMSKYYSEISKCEQQMISIENKESKERQKMYKELLQLKTKLLKKDDEVLMTKFNTLNDKYSNYSLDKEKDKTQEKLNQLNNNHKELITKFNKSKESIYNNVFKEVNHYTTKENKTKIEGINNIFWNALNSIEIGYGIEDAKPISFKKKK